MARSLTPSAISDAGSGGTPSASHVSGRGLKSLPCGACVHREAGGSARWDRWVSVGGGDGTAHGAVTLPVSQALIVALGSLSTDGWGWRQSIQGGRVHLLLNPVSIFRAVVSMYTSQWV